MVVIVSGWAHNADGDPGVTGYTEIADLYANSTYDANLSLAWLVCGSTPPTSFSVNVQSATASPSFAIAGVFLGVDNTTPVDVAPVTATATGNIVGTLPGVTPVTSGAAVYTCMVSAASGSTTAFLNGVPAGYTSLGWTKVAGSSYTVLAGGAVKFNCAAHSLFAVTNYSCPSSCGGIFCTTTGGPGPATCDPHHIFRREAGLG